MNRKSYFLIFCELSCDLCTVLHSLIGAEVAKSGSETRSQLENIVIQEMERSIAKTDRGW